MFFPPKMEFHPDYGKYRLGLAFAWVYKAFTEAISNPKAQGQSLHWPVKFMLAYLLVTVSSVSSTAVDDCHNTAKNTHLYLATKTPYRFITDKASSTLQFQGCDATRMWMLLRHGTRNPGSKMIRRMRERLPELRDEILGTHKAGRGQLCKETLSYLEGWLPHVEEADEKRLTHEGEDEMIDLAERFQNRFPDLLPDTYTNSSYKFRYTATQRTKESARYFTIGLFGRRVSNHVWFPEALHRDPILRFYKLCNRWRTEVDKNPESLLEKNKFTQSLLVKASLEDISHRLGFNSIIDFVDAQLMYMTCAFETAWEKRRTSPWCSVFSEANLQVMEYLQDLEYFWIDGYGYDLTYRQACPAFRDMMQHFKSEREDDAPPPVVAYFTHSGTLLKMLAHLGLYQDEHVLRHDNFNTTAANRQWRVGRVDGFASNLVFVLYQCGDDKKVLTMHQERPVTLPGCPVGDLCPLDLLTNIYGDSINKCDFDQMCAMPAPAA